jgi:hypothetical protein
MIHSWLAVASLTLATAGDSWNERIDALARNGAQVETIARSAAGSQIRVVTLPPPKDAAAERPLLLVVAGADAGHAVGVDVALGIAETLAATPPPWLSSMDVAIVPCLNPDGFAKRSPAVHGGRLPLAVDADRDGRLDEDGGDDLDGDGMVLAMRVRNPAPATGLAATHCDDPEWPGLMRAADRAKGDVPSWAVLVEGLDDDGDGRFNEDGRGGAAGGGLDLDRQWPASWPEFEDGAGRRPLQTAETRGLAEWCLSQERLVGVLVFGRHDTLVSIPEPGKMEVSGTVPQGIAEPDKWIWELVGAKFKEVTGIHESPTADLRGSLLLWASSHLGVISMGTPVWVRPDLVKPERRGEASAALKESDQAAAEPTQEGAEPKPEPPKEPEAKTDEAKWVRYFAQRVAAGGTPGFVAWKPFSHPQLGPVEIGGFIPHARANPPASELPRLVSQQTAFMGEFAALLPRISQRAWATRLAPGVWRIDARVSNEGRLPTRTSMGAKARWGQPTLVQLEMNGATLLSGRSVQRTDSIPGGGVFDASWTVRADDGAALKVKVSDRTWGERVIEVPLIAAAGAVPDGATGGER